jgi:hypothetical protein
VDLYNVVHEWETRGREKDLYPRRITVVTHVLLRYVGLLKYYEEDTSLKGHYGLLVHLIHQWDVHRQDLCVGPDQWYDPTEEDMYFITRIFTRGEYFPQFPDVPIGVYAKS